MSKRRAALYEWLCGELKRSQVHLEPASGDASFRRYFRVYLDGESNSLIAMDAPPEKEDCQPFVALAKRLESQGLHVPAIHAQDLERGFLLLEDLGSIHYLDALDEKSVDRLYGDALSALIVIQSCVRVEGLPIYDQDMLMGEMGLFREWLVNRHLGTRLGSEEEEMLDCCFHFLTSNALAQPSVCVLRDFHSRNLMVSTSPSPGILDFQDAVSGPVTYDLVSLLKDCYISWPRSRVDDWARGYFELAVQSGVLRDDHESKFLNWFHLMGVQRHLKAAGIFARLFRRDGKPGYLKDIPRTLGYVTELELDYPELTGLVRLIRRLKLD
ncbi:MAG: phosphotransferase [Gammaproteobacteria bacterium]|nr:phosphotransferase [Gammaproteobacteria bacterium]